MVSPGFWMNAQPFLSRRSPKTKGRFNGCCIKHIKKNLLPFDVMPSYVWMDFPSSLLDLSLLWMSFLMLSIRLSAGWKCFLFLHLKLETTARYDSHHMMGRRPQVTENPPLAQVILNWFSKGLCFSLGGCDKSVRISHHWSGSIQGELFSMH